MTGSLKGGRERTVDLPASVVDLLEGHRHLRGPYVFCQEDGQPLTEGLKKLAHPGVDGDGQRHAVPRYSCSLPCEGLLSLRVTRQLPSAPHARAAALFAAASGGAVLVGCIVAAAHDIPAAVWARNAGAWDFGAIVAALLARG